MSENPKIVHWSHHYRKPSFKVAKKQLSWFLYLPSLFLGCISFLHLNIFAVQLGGNLQSDWPNPSYYKRVHSTELTPWQQSGFKLHCMCQKPKIWGEGYKWHVTQWCMWHVTGVPLDNRHSSERNVQKSQLNLLYGQQQWRAVRDGAVVQCSAVQCSAGYHSAL